MSAAARATSLEKRVTQLATQLATQLTTQLGALVRTASFEEVIALSNGHAKDALALLSPPMPRRDALAIERAKKQIKRRRPKRAAKPTPKHAGFACSFCKRTTKMDGAGSGWASVGLGRPLVRWCSRAKCIAASQAKQRAPGGRRAGRPNKSESAAPTVHRDVKPANGTKRAAPSVEKGEVSPPTRKSAPPPAPRVARVPAPKMNGAAAHALPADGRDYALIDVKAKKTLCTFVELGEASRVSMRVPGTRVRRISTGTWMTVASGAPWGGDEPALAVGDEVVDSEGLEELAGG